MSASAPVLNTNLPVRVAVLPLRRRLSGCVRCPRYIAVSTEAMARFLAAMSPVGTETFFEGVRERLLPAHWMKYRLAESRSAANWHPIDTLPIAIKKTADYIDDFRERFDRPSRPVFPERAASASQ